MKLLDVGKGLHGWAHVPWSSGEELKTLRDDLFSDNLKAVQSALNKVEGWQAVYEEVSLKIIATCQLLRSQLRDPLSTPCPESISVMGSLRDPELASGYSLAILRATSSTIDPVKQNIPIKMELVAASQSFPDSCTEARHAIVHGQMPSLPHLRIVAAQCLNFLLTSFWNEIVELYNVTHEKLHKELTNFFHIFNRALREKAKLTNPHQATHLYQDSSSEEEPEVSKGEASLIGAKNRKETLRLSGSILTLVNVSMEKTTGVLIENFLPKKESKGLHVLMTNSPTMQTSLARNLTRRLTSGTPVEAGWVQWLVDSSRTMPATKIKRLLAYMIDKMYEAFTLKNASIAATPVMKAFESILDNGLNSSRLTEEQVDSYHKLAKLLQEDQGQKKYGSGIKEPRPTNDYIPLCVEDSSTPDLVSLEDVAKLEMEEVNTRKRNAGPKDDQNTNSGPWERVANWSPCAIGSIYSASSLHARKRIKQGDGARS